MKAIDLTVDGNEVDVRNCFFHAQSEPWPGGLQYEMRVTEEEVIHSIQTDYPRGEHGPIDCRNADLIFRLIRLVVSVKGGQAPRRYWINTIAKLVVEEGVVTLWGECSLNS